MKGSIYDRIIKYTIPCKCKYCEEMFEHDIEYPNMRLLQQVLDRMWIISQNLNRFNDSHL